MSEFIKYQTIGYRAKLSNGNGIHIQPARQGGLLFTFTNDETTKLVETHVALSMECVEVMGKMIDGILKDIDEQIEK